VELEGVGFQSTSKHWTRLFQSWASNLIGCRISRGYTIFYRIKTLYTQMSKKLLESTNSTNSCRSL